MRKKYRKSGSVIIPIIVLAVIAVMMVIYFIYAIGTRYIKTSGGDKFFGYIDNKTDEIINGHIWRSDGDTINIARENFRTVIFRPDLSDSAETDFSNLLYGAEIGSDILNEVGILVKTDNALNNFVLNDTESEYYLLRETVNDFILNQQALQNVILEGEFTDTGGVIWRLVSDKEKVSGYKDYNIVDVSDNSVMYKGDLFSFFKKGEIESGYILLKDSTQIMMYREKAPIYRLDINFSSKNKNLYIGEIDGEFKKNGIGIYYSYTGDVFYGEFKDDERTGHFSVRTSFGDLYDGQLINGRKSGEGTYIWSDGTTYTGGFFDDMKNGYGKYQFTNGESYEGDYLNDVKHGKGTYVWANGDRYVGDFLNDVRTGYGTYTWKEAGESYEGEFKDNELHGEGTYYWSSGRDYTGFYDKGKMVLERPED